MARKKKATKRTTTGQAKKRTTASSVSSPKETSETEEASDGEEAGEENDEDEDDDDADEGDSEASQEAAGGAEDTKPGETQEQAAARRKLAEEAVLKANKGVALFRAIVGQNALLRSLIELGTTEDVPLEPFAKEHGADVVELIGQLKFLEGVGIGDVVHGRREAVLRWVWSVAGSKAVLDGASEEFAVKRAKPRVYERQSYKYGVKITMDRKTALALAKHLGKDDLSKETFQAWATTWIEEALGMLKDEPSPAENQDPEQDAQEPAA